MNLELHEFDVEFTQEIDHRDSCGDHTHFTQNPGYTATWRIICKYLEGWVADAWLAEHSKSIKEFKLLARRKHNVTAIVHL